MTDRYAHLREALEALPEPGEWYYAGCNTVHDENHDEVAHPVDMRNDCAIAEFIAASSPKVIRALLAERDALIHDNAEYVRAANELAAENERLREELDQLRQDAARYRWLRDPCSGAERVIFYCRGDYGRGLMSSAMLDAAIDAAIQRESGRQG